MDGPGSDPRQHPFLTRPHRTLVALSVPVMLSLVAEPLTGLVDTAFVARLGPAPLAALGVGTVLLSSLLWVFNFLGVGTQTEVAHAWGARDRDAAREVAGTALALAGGLGLLLGLLLWPVLEPLSRFMGAEGPVLDGALVYLRIRLLGAPALLAMMAAFGVLRGRHDMRAPLWIAAGINLLNAGLDAVLIPGWGPFPKLGIAGAAWATVAAQWVGVALGVLAVGRRVGWPTRIEAGRVGTLLVVGRDLLLRTGLLVLFISLGTRAATLLGPDAGAAHQAIRQVWLLTALALDAFAASAQSLVGSFLGARMREEARRAAGVAAVWGLGTGAVLTVAMLAFQDAVARLFVPDEARLLFASAWWITAVAQPLNAVSFVTDGIHWGTRDYRYLRNGMFLASGVGVALLFGSELADRASLAAIWWITGLWIAVRAALGALRVWPGVGRAPLSA
ncbi:MAG: MATE family efflux transporter [Myxococcota bacterium]